MSETEELLEAIRLTQEYVQLPAFPGWSWYDAYAKHRPDDAARFRAEWEGRATEWRMNRREREMVKIGEDVIYRTDGRNGLIYDLPAKVVVTRDSHPGDYPSEDEPAPKNPLPVPASDEHVHLVVFTPGGFGTKIGNNKGETFNPVDSDFIGATALVPGSGTYVELNVLKADEGEEIPPRSWRRML